MGVLTVQENRIIFQKRDELAVIEAWGADCLRFRSSPNARLSDENWNLLVQPQTSCSAVVEGDRAVITNGKISAEMFSSGKVVFYRDGKEILAERSEMAFHMKFRDYRSLGGDNHRATVVFQPCDK